MSLSSRSVWSPRGGFSEAANNKTSPGFSPTENHLWSHGLLNLNVLGTPGSTSSNSSCGSHKKGASPSPTSRIPVSSFRDNVELGLTLSQSLICDNQAKPIANNSSSIDVSATPLTSGNYGWEKLHHIIFSILNANKYLEKFISLLGSLSKLTAKATGTASMLR